MLTFNGVRRILELAAVSVAASLVCPGWASATAGSDWLPLTGTDIKVGCTWNNCSGVPTHTVTNKGIDFLVPSGRPVYASGNGTITAAANSGGDRGIYITINHGTHSSRYLHLSSIVVGSGTVSAGQHIAYSGSSGATSAHLHYDELTNPTQGTGKLDPGTLHACHGASKVAYPGAGGWPGYPYASVNLRNDGYGCSVGRRPASDVDGDGKSDVCFLSGVNGGTTGSGKLEVHCALAGAFQSRVDQATPFGYINTQNAFPFSADVDGDGKSDVCFLSGVNGGTTGSGKLEVHCALAGAFQSRVDQATPFGYINTQNAFPFSADVDGDGKSDVCFLSGVNGGTTGSGKLEVHCALAGAFQSRVDQATPFGYINTQNAFPFSADVDGDGKSDVCFLSGVNGGTTGSGKLEVHCALAGAFQSRVDQATPFGYINTENAFPFSADVDGDGKSDVCFLSGVNGGTTGSGKLEVHCALAGAFQSRVDQATPFGYINTQNAFPFSADVDGDGKSDVCFLSGVNGGTTGSGKLEVHCALAGAFQSRVDQATPFGYINTQSSWVTNHGPTAPLAPGNITAQASDGSALVSFSAPWDGGNPIASYIVIASPGDIRVSGPSSPITIGGLANGTSYTFTVAANNGFGPGPASAASNAVTPAATDAWTPMPIGASAATGGTPTGDMGKSPAKLSLLRASIDRRARKLDVFAPITALASGEVDVELFAAGRRTRGAVTIDARRRRVRVQRGIPVAQARLGTGILTMRYAGNGRTRPQTVRLRAARRPARLVVRRPTLSGGGRLRASGTIRALARGVVRVQVQFDDASGGTRTLAFRAPVRSGRWALNERLDAATRNEIAARRGTVHSYTLFTGYARARMRGEMRSLQILGTP